MIIGAAFLIASLLAQTPAARESTDPIVAEVLVETVSDALTSTSATMGSVDSLAAGVCVSSDAIRNAAPMIISSPPGPTNATVRLHSDPSATSRSK